MVFSWSCSGKVFRVHFVNSEVFVERVSVCVLFVQKLFCFFCVSASFVCTGGDIMQLTKTQTNIMLCVGLE